MSNEHAAPRSIGGILRFPAVEALVGGILLGLSFPPSPFYTLGYVAFIPLWHALERTSSWMRALRVAYAFVFAFHLTTVYWTGGFTVMRDVWMMAAGAALLFVHPLFYAPSVLLGWWVMRKRGRAAGLVAFISLWLAFEYLHSLGELSFPWITIGNGQAYDLARAQIVEYTSVLGLSLLLLVFNAVSYAMTIGISAGRYGFRRIAWMSASLVLIFFGPWIAGNAVLQKVESGCVPTLRVGCVQLNIDPWEKWGNGAEAKWKSYQSQLDRHLDATRALSKERPDLVVWPETAIPFHILHPLHAGSLERVLRETDTLGISILTGVPTAEYFPSSKAPVTAEPIGNSGLSVESYNSAVVFSPGHRVSPVYRKMILVPFGERIPYAEFLSFLIAPLKWNVGIGNWGIGKDTVVFRVPLRNGDTAGIAPLICYESVYPRLVREFVKKGAQILVVITNDSWWGNTSGAYQHAAMASLRAIETRRWVIQAANGGITLAVNPAGQVVSRTELYTSANVILPAARCGGETFYVRHGDIVGPLSLCCSGLFVMFSLIPLRRKTS